MPLQNYYKKELSLVYRSAWWWTWKCKWEIRLTKVSYKRQLCSEHQTVYTLRVKRSCMSKVNNHNKEHRLHMAGKPHRAETCFSTET